MGAHARFFFWSLLGVGLLLAVATALQGAVPQVIFSHDTPLFYDAGWRAYCGLRPHVDFYSPLGPVIYLYVAAGYLLFGLHTDSLAYLNALALLVLIGLSWLLLRGRLPGFWVFWVSLLIGLCFMAPYPLRQPFWSPGYTMLYNRQGYAWLLLLAMLLFSPAGVAPAARLKAAAFWIGAIVAILFFLKVSFFITAVLMLAAFFLVGGTGGFRLSGAHFGAGLAAVSLPLLAYLRFDVVSMFEDFSITAGAKAMYPLYHRAKMQDNLFAMTDQVLIAVLLVLFAAGFPRLRLDSEAAKKRFRRNAILCLVFVGCSALLGQSNAPWGYIEDHPLLPAFAVLVAIGVLEDRFPGAAGQPGGAAGGLPAKVVPVTAWLLVAVEVTRHALGIAHAYPLPPGYTRIQSPTMGGLVLCDERLGWDYAHKINDGLQLLRKNGATTGRIATFDLTSPFAFALQSPPAGGCLFWELAINITPDFHPSEDKVFKDVDFLMMPLFPESAPGFEACASIYGKYIDTHFRLIDQSAKWRLLGRRREGGVAVEESSGW